MEFSEAMEDARESIEMAKKVGHQRAEMIGADLAGIIELERGNFAQARAYLTRGLELSELLRAGSFVAQARFILARLDMVEGNMQSAQENIDIALVKVRELGTAFIGPAVLAVCAELSDDAKQRTAYLQEAERILDSGCVSHNQFHFARTAIDLGLQLSDWEAVERYALRLDAYTADQALEWPNYMIARGRALIARENGDHSEECRNQIQQLRNSGEQAGLRLVLSALESGMPKA